MNSKTTHTEEHSSPDQQLKKRRKSAMILFSIIIVIVIVGYLIYWLAVLRFEQNTDDAYVAGNTIQIISRVNGSVTEVHVDDTDLVTAGQELVTLDATDAQQMFEKAKIALANSVRQTNQLIINHKQAASNVTLRQTDYDRVVSDLARREVLAKQHVISTEDLQHAQDAVKSAKSALDIAQHQYEASEAVVLNTPIDQQPGVLASAAQLREAWLALQRTHIVSPVTGYISQRNVQVGGIVSPARPLMVVVPIDQLWVTANFKETQLADLRLNQPVTLISDIYGNNVTYRGHIVGMDMGTGSAFSILPAQNATGNWIKVVQRLPVRIDIDKAQLEKYPLRIGLSMNVTVDTHDKSGNVLAQNQNQDARYQSKALVTDLAPINKIIQQIIIENTRQ